MHHHHHIARALAEARVADLQRANAPVAAGRPATSTASSPLAICQLLRKATAVARLTLTGTPAP